MSEVPRPAPSNFTDHVFKTINGLDLSVRLWPADPLPAPGMPAPFVIWTHGGSYLVGKHFAPLVWLEPGLRARGFHIVSHSYRLAPQARIDESLSDCLDAVTWCRVNLPHLLGQDRVDVDRYVVCGDSSGGTLATLLGHYADPPPRVVIDVYGVIDFESMGWLGDEAQKQLPSIGSTEWKGEFTEAELHAFLSDRNPANTLDVAPPWIARYTEEQLSKQWATQFRYTKRIRLQTELHVWRTNRGKQGIKSDLLKAVIHEENFPDRKALSDFLASVSPLRLLDGNTRYPPTAFLHGTADSVVPISQSIKMAEVLKSMGVPTVECYESGMKHGFDSKYTVSVARRSSSVHADTDRVRMCLGGTCILYPSWTSSMNTSRINAAGRSIH
jgi:acetyl esterase/lipase